MLSQYEDRPVIMAASTFTSNRCPRWSVPVGSVGDDPVDLGTK